MYEPHIIIGSAIGPAGPAPTAAGPSSSPPAGQPVAHTETASAVRPSPGVVETEAQADVESPPGGETPPDQTAQAAPKDKHRARRGARRRALRANAEESLDADAAREDSPGEDRDQDEPATEPESERPTSSIRGRAGGMALEVAHALAFALWRSTKALGSLGWSIAVRYPRHSLAAAASVVILGAIEYTQWNGSKEPPVTQISGAQSAGKGAKSDAAASPSTKPGEAEKKLADQKIAQADTKRSSTEKDGARVVPAAAAAPSQAEAAPRDKPPSPASAAPTDASVQLAAPTGQPAPSQADKTAQSKTESAVVSAPGLIAAAPETLPPPASSLGKQGAMPLESSTGPAQPAPAPSGSKTAAATGSGMSEPGDLSGLELTPAPAPATKPEKGQNAGELVKPAPLPAAVAPDQPPPSGPGQPPANDALPPAPAALNLDSAPAPAPNATGSAPAPLPANPPSAPDGRTDTLPPPAEAAPLITASGLAATGPPPSPAPRAPHDTGAPSRTSDPVKAPAPEGSKPGTDSRNRKTEPATDQAHAGSVDSPAKPKAEDKPDLGPILASPPLADAASEAKSTPSAAAASNASPEDTHDGQIQRAPKTHEQPVTKPAISQIGQDPERSQQIPPSALELPPATDSPNGHESKTAEKLTPEISRPTDASGSPPNRTESHPEPITPAVAETTPPGWVAIRNSGKLPLAAGDEPDPRAVDGGDRPAAKELTREFGAHAAKDMSFEMESLRPRAMASSSGARGSPIGDGTSEPPGGDRRVETVPHVVEPNENFWTISRQYYGSGRYYRALWKANADRCPRIDGLYVNDVIIIPPPEDLDPGYILPPGESGRSNRSTKGDKPNDMPGARARRRSNAPEGSESTADSTSTDTNESPRSRRRMTGARTNQLSNTEDGIPIQRSSQTSNELDLPAASTEPIFARDRRSAERRADLSAGEDDGDPQVRSARRPRSADDESDRVPDTRPVYKVRAGDTLRSIARDTLGTSRRANDILEMNREKIDDPDNLIVGQILELPEGARTSIRRRASR
jgi:nucleoid-associated protein YgaU